MKQDQLLGLVLKAVGMAMGIAVIVLNVLGTAAPQTMIMMLGIGLFALGLDALQKVK